ncbi:hypothetical protein DM02DRAFT_727269 [Periconia macrospinosa]|uniref:Methylated-DNA--protein-cysteine methyltransferase n=1 Tax=Periconia macrospinosa TaxID=97972 RepID=A0A2V1DVF2_9PLEO|nr:hypothetical protein DM02DRAFT_727269 [Periconia macrospinosa]
MQSKRLPPGTVTPFQARIYALVQQIPRGKVCSYASLARAASKIPSSSTSTSTSPTTISNPKPKPATLHTTTTPKHARAARGGGITKKPKAVVSSKVSKEQQGSKGSGSKKCSPRAVGSALRRNPFAPEVPCHRVVGSNGFIAGFRGSWDKLQPEGGGGGGRLGITQTQKRELLREEGVEFDERGVLVDNDHDGKDGKEGSCWWDGFDVGKV